MKVKISIADLVTLIFYARRYCDGRSTYAPHEFNRLYDRINDANDNKIALHDIGDKSLMHDGSYWPYAQDGMCTTLRDHFDAVPRHVIAKRAEQDRDNKK